MNHDEYQEYLESDKWKARRERALERAGQKCQVCASIEKLEVHHNSYENLGNEKDEDLVVLCGRCHRLHHIAADQDESAAVTNGADLMKLSMSRIELSSKIDGWPGIETGFPRLDNLLQGLQKANYIVIGARPSVGKTSLALSMIRHITLRKGIPTLLFSLEMSKETIGMRLISQESRIGLQISRGGFLRPTDFANLTNAAGAYYQAPLYVADGSKSRFSDIAAISEYYVKEYSVGVIFVDYLTLVRPDERFTSRHEQVASLSRSFKELAMRLNVPIVVLSQVNRETDGRRPSLANLRESGSIEQDADVVLFLHRERNLDQETTEAMLVMETELIVAKQRNGPVGTIKVAFIPRTTEFANLAEE
nr:hypothetical protein 7 [Spirochaetaceae bacterium]